METIIMPSYGLKWFSTATRAFTSPSPSMSRLLWQAWWWTVMGHEGWMPRPEWSILNRVQTGLQFITIHWISISCYLICQCQDSTPDIEIAVSFIVCLMGLCINGAMPIMWWILTQLRKKTLLFKKCLGEAGVAAQQASCSLLASHSKFWLLS